MKALNFLMGLMVLVSFTSAQAADTGSTLTIEMQEDAEAYPGDEYQTRQGFVVAFDQTGDPTLAVRMENKQAVPEMTDGKVILRVDTRRLDCAELVIIPPADLLKLRSDGADHTLTLQKVAGSESSKECVSAKLDGKDIKLNKTTITSEPNEDDTNVYVLDLK